jgi:SAM-dependent methyltransferase
VQVKRNFDRIYAEEGDPWSIGAAADPRYDQYRELVLSRAHGGSLLDVGCGLGAFLARFRDRFDELTGVETAAGAVRRARQAHPDIEFVHARAEQLAQTALHGREFDAILVSDVIYYLAQPDRERLIKWVAEHLAPGGWALIAAWCPGGRYLEPSELRALVRSSLRIADDLVLPSGHVALMCEPRRRLVALTFDYETWQPIPAGETIDWEQDVFAPTEALLAAAEDEGFQVTLFAEAGEYLWLDENDPSIARRMDDQWRRAVERGHDLQLHLHPSWLPETGARHDEQGWWWDESLAKADAYPGDLDELIARCARRIEEVVRPASPGFRVTCYRAGAYQAQPFDRLANALLRAGIGTDSSVFAGGVSLERGYDYSQAWSTHQPWFASSGDPQHRGSYADRAILELPIAVAGGSRLMLDGAEAERLPERAVAALRETAERTPEALRRRRRFAAGLARVGLGRLAPPAPVAPDVGHDYLVAIGHTKGDLRVAAVAAAATELRGSGFEIVTLADMAAIARRDLEETPSADVLTSDRTRLRRLLPFDRDRVLLVGEAIEDALYPWMQGTPEGDSLDAAVLDQPGDVDRALREAGRALRAGGVLVGAFRERDVDQRLAAAGFTAVETQRTHDLVYARAWRRMPGTTQLDRAREAMTWIYNRLDPEHAHASNDPIDVITGGVAFCAGYALSLFELLEREGVDVRVGQMEAVDHPRGRGPDQVDTHVVVQARVDGRWIVLDPMAGTVLDHPLRELLAHPGLAKGRIDPDARHERRGYRLYDSEFWYSRVRRYRLDRSLNPKVRIWRRC